MINVRIQKKKKYQWSEVTEEKKSLTAGVIESLIMLSPVQKSFQKSPNKYQSHAYLPLTLMWFSHLLKCSVALVPCYN